MKFSSIGTLQNHMKSMELQMKWQQKQKNPGAVETSQPAGGTSAPNGKYNAFALEQKLKTGKSLSSEEMQYLRNNYPDLYSQAVSAERERSSYKSQLSGSKTKDDVMRANMHRVAALHDELVSVQSDPNLSQGEKFKLSVGIHMKAQAVSDEHAEFQRSSEYQKLPTEQELAEKSKEAKKQKEAEHAKTKEADNKEEKTPDADNRADEIPEPQIDSAEPGDFDGRPVFEPEAAKPAPDTAEPASVPEAAAPQPQAANSYAGNGYAPRNIPGGYAGGGGHAREGMNIGV